MSCKMSLRSVKGRQRHPMINLQFRLRTPVRNDIMCAIKLCEKPNSASYSGAQAKVIARGGGMTWREEVPI